MNINACLKKVASVKEHNDFNFVIELDKKKFEEIKEEIGEKTIKTKDGMYVWEGVLVKFIFPEIHFYPLDFDFSVFKK